MNKIMRKGSIFNRFLILMIAVIILPMVLIYSLVSSVFIGQLHENYNEAVRLSSYVSAQTIKDAIGNVVDISVSIIGDSRIRDFLLCDSREDYLKKYNLAQSMLNHYYIGNQYISNISILSADGEKILAAGGTGFYDISEEEREEMLDSIGGWFWSETKGRASICRLIRNTEDPEEKLGFIKILVDERNLKNQFYIDEEKTQYTYTLVDEKAAAVVLSTKEGNTDQIIRILDKKKEEGGEEKLFVMREDQQYFVYRQMTIHTRPCYLVVTARDQTVYYDVLKYGVIFLMLVLFLVFWGLYAMLYRKSIGLPLEMLGKQMKHLKPDSGAPEQISIRAEGEVKELVDAFNAMAVKLDYLYGTNYQNELRLRDSNLLILQSEINPHFLYNVLDSIRWMIELGEKEVASSMVQLLSEMFRLSLTISEQTVIGLEKELEHLEKYIALQRYRFGNKIRFGINIQENLKNPMTVKFILQPLVENAIVHGIGNDRGYGNIVISVYSSDHELVFDIRDDGCGADPEQISGILLQKLRKENSLEGFALENIQARLQLRYGSQYGITFQPREEGGSIFTVRQPLIYGEEEAYGDAKTDDCG